MDTPNQFLAVLHDLKNPLLAIERLSNLLREDDELSDDTRRKIALIHDSAAEASRYLKAVDPLSDSTVPGEASTEEVDLSDLAQNVVTSFRTHAECKSQELRCQTMDDDCVVKGSPLQLRVAMNNLVSNALKYTPRGGTIKVWVERAEDEVCFAVSDNGPGISENDQKRLGTPFQELEPSPTGGEDSSGIGLYFVRQIVDRHEGAIDVETAEGVGSTFVLTFPAVGSQDTTHESTQEDERSGLPAVPSPS
jgi:signal transduction histidine kinase